VHYFSGRVCVLAWVVFISNVMWVFFRQSLCFGVACVCVNAFHTGLLSADQAVECIHKIQNMTAKHLEVSCTNKSNSVFL